MKVKFYTSTREYNEKKAEFDLAIESYIKNGISTLGKEVQQFEQDVQNFTGAKHAIGVASGTDALVSFVCDAFNAYAIPAAIMTINAENYSIKTIDRKIEVTGKYSNVTLFNVQGRIIQSTINMKPFTSNDLTPGMYIIRVDSKSYKQIIN